MSERHKDKQPVNPFPEGLALMTAVNKCASYFSYGERAEDLRRCCDEARCSTARPHVDWNSTRINAKIELLTGTLRIERGLTLY